MKVDRLPAHGYPDAQALAEATRAAERRAHAMLEVTNARQRAALYPRELMIELGVGVTGKMLAMVMRGEIVPKDAKQALDIAKIALDIVRIESGMDGAAVEKPADRAAKIERAGNVIDILRKRQEAAGDVTAAAHEAFDAAEWEGLAQ